MKNLLSILCIVGLLVSCGTESNPTYTLTTSVSPSEGGSIAPSSGVYSKGETVTLQATPSDGWRFKEWGGDLSGDEVPVQIMINDEKNVTVTFGSSVKTFGGSGDEVGYRIAQTTDGGYVLTGFTSSNDGDFIGMNKGREDIFGIFLDSQGKL